MSVDAGGDPGVPAKVGGGVGRVPLVFVEDPGRFEVRFLDFARLPVLRSKEREVLDQFLLLFRAEFLVGERRMGLLAALAGWRHVSGFFHQRVVGDAVDLRKIVKRIG